MRSLTADNGRRSRIALLLVLALLVGWALWFFRAKVPVYEVAEAARVEVDGAVNPVQALVAGRVVSSRLRLGRQVRQGETLIELESDAQRLELAEARTRLASLGPQLAALRQEEVSARQAGDQMREAMRAAVGSARAQQRQAAAEAQFALQQAARLRELHDTGGIAEMEIQRARAEAQARRAATEALSESVARLQWGHMSQQSERQARLDQLRRQIAEVEGAIVTTRAAIARLELEIDLRKIRAPVSGRLGEVVDLRPGTVVAQGDRLGSVVPTGRLRVIAEFLPTAALGRVRPGQRATLRLDGFPWTQWGTIPARVMSVGTETRQGRVRVELLPRPHRNSPIPLQHGLPGSVEIEVERTTPAALVMRAAGQLGSRGSSSSPPDPRVAGQSSTEVAR